MGPMVQRGDVFRLDIPGDNGETKRRVCVVLDLAPPAPGRTIAAIFIFGCSETKARAASGTFLRIEAEQRQAFNALTLSNPTSFHVEDVRVYEATSPMLAPDRRLGRCPPATMIEFRQLLVRRYLDATPIRALPSQARSETREVAAALTRGRGDGAKGA